MPEEYGVDDDERLRVFFDSIPNAITVTDLKGIVTECNQATLDIYGYSSRMEIIGKSAFDFIAEKDHERAKKNLERTLRNDFIKNVEYLCETRTGRQFLAELSANVVKNPSGKPIGFVAVTRECTKEKTLSALNAYGRKLNTAGDVEEVYELTLDAMQGTLGFEHAAFMIIDKGHLVVVSQRGYPFPLTLSLPLDGKKGITVKSANSRRSILVSDTTKNGDFVEGILGIKSELSVPIVTEESVLGVLNVESKRLGAFNGKDLMLLQILASHASTAISNLEKREEIEKRSSQLSSLMKSSTKMMSTADLHQRLQTIAEAIREVGWRRIVISLRDKKMEIRERGDLVTAGLTEEEREHLWKNKSSGRVWKERFGPDYVRFKVGEFYHLPWSDSWVRRRFSASTIPSKIPPDEMVDWDPQDLLYAPLRLSDKRIVGVLSIDDPVDGKRPTKESLATLELFIHQAAVAIENAQLIHSLTKAREQLKADAEQLESKVEERTRELRESQKRLLKAERLATMGELARMVGHDLRNPLTGIAGATYYLKSKLGDRISHKSREMLHLIERDIEYSNKIINDLLEYSGEIQLDIKTISLKQIFMEALALVKIPTNISVTDLIDERQRLEVDPDKMKRVFVNLIKNSIHAMPSGGKLQIQSRESNGKLSIKFTDTGIGISGKAIGKIWTPLFTTKAKGMGLGLSICKRLVEVHGGVISAKSIIGKGTTITIEIPVRSDSKGGEVAWVGMPESLLSTTKTV